METDGTKRSHCGLDRKEAASLVQLAQSKLDNLENEMRELFRNKELESQVQIVGDRMGAFSREYRVNYADGDVSNAVQEPVNQIMSIGSEKAGAPPAADQPPSRPVPVSAEIQELLTLDPGDCQAK